jgi:hypothetical protein
MGDAAGAPIERVGQNVTTHGGGETTEQVEGSDAGGTQLSLTELRGLAVAAGAERGHVASPRYSVLGWTTAK